MRETSKSEGNARWTTPGDQVHATPRTAPPPELLTADQPHHVDRTPHPHPAYAGWECRGQQEVENPPHAPARGAARRRRWPDGGDQVHRGGEHRASRRVYMSVSVSFVPQAVCVLRLCRTAFSWRYPSPPWPPPPPTATSHQADDRHRHRFTTATSHLPASSGPRPRQRARSSKILANSMSVMQHDIGSVQRRLADIEETVKVLAFNIQGFEVGSTDDPPPTPPSVSRPSSAASSRPSSRPTSASNGRAPPET